MLDYLVLDLYSGRTAGGQNQRPGKETDERPFSGGEKTQVSNTFS